MAAVTFIGLGTMGSGMVRNLLKAGHVVRVYNRDGAKAQALVAAGADAAGSIAEAVAGASFLMYCLSDDAAVEQVVFGEDGVLAHVQEGQTVLDLSTIDPALGAREHEAFAAKGVDFLDSPVFGTRGEAEAGGLWVVVGGDRDVYERALVVLEPISETRHYVGGPTSGQRMKLVGNLLVGSQIRAIGDAMVLATRLGLDPATLLDVAAVTDFRTPIYAGVGARSLAGDHAPDFALALLLKDLRLIGEVARRAGVDIAGLESSTALAQEGVDAGMGELNASALVEVVARRAGVTLVQQRVGPGAGPLAER